MTKQEFRDDYLVDAFFWVNEKNYLKLQDILHEFGFKLHTGDGIIGWHEGFKNLQTFSHDEWHNFDYYQKTDFWHDGVSYGKPKDYDKMIEDYNNL